MKDQPLSLEQVSRAFRRLEGAGDRLYIKRLDMCVRTFERLSSMSVYSDPFGVMERIKNAPCFKDDHMAFGFIGIEYTNGARQVIDLRVHVGASSYE